MKTGIIFLFFCTRLFVRALPVNDKEILSSSCIEMTAEREQEIHKIVDEVNSFIETLSEKHEDIDFTSVELKIEKHSDDEHDEKETVLKIVINDCKNACTKTEKPQYLDNNLAAEDYSKAAKETSTEDSTEYATKSDVEKHTDFEKNSESKERENLKVKEKRSKIDANANSVKITNHTHSESIEDLGEEPTGENDNGSQPKDKTTRQSLQDDEIENLIKDLEELNDKQRLGDSDNGVYIYAPTIDNSKIEITNNYDEQFKDLYNSAIQKVAILETELEKIKQAKTDSGLSNFKELFNKFGRNSINPYYGFGGNLFNNYVSSARNSVYGNTGLEVIYFND